MSEAYQIAADLSDRGQIATGSRLTRALSDISRILMTYTFEPENIEGELAGLREHTASLADEDDDERQPTVVGIAVGRYMQRVRQTHSLTVEEVSDLIGIPAADICLLELGRITLNARTIRRMLNLYGVDEPGVHSDFVRLIDEAARSGWWTRYNDILPDWLRSYIHLEQCADIIRTFEAHFIPGLLQTEGYARSIMETVYLESVTGSDLDKRKERRLHLRLDRQRIVRDANGPRLWAVIDGSALTRSPASPDAMKDQIMHLIEMSNRKNVTIQILPDDKAHSAFASFSILRFTETELPNVVYTEQLTSALYLDRLQDVDPYLKLMNELCIDAYTPEKSVEYLFRLRRELDHKN